MPPTRRSSVLLPEPLVPRIATISPAVTENPIDSSAGPLSNRLERALISSISIRISERGLPGQRAPSQSRQSKGGEFAENGEQQDAGDDNGRAAGLLAVD